MDSISNAVAQPELLAQGDTGRKRRIAASLLSAALPGTGHLLLNSKKIGVGFLSAFCVLTLLYWPIRLPRFYVGSVFLTYALMGLCAVAGWHALRSPSERASKGSRWWLFLVIPLSLAFADLHIAWLLHNAAGIRLFRVPAASMEPTILKGDYIAVDLRQYRDSRPKRGDIVVFRKNGLIFVKRVVAVGIDTILGQDVAIIVNGKRLEEPYVQHVGNAPLQLNSFRLQYIPPGKLFVMGDNRDVSLDSRSPPFGLVDEGSVVGKPLYIVRPRIFMYLG